MFIFSKIQFSKIDAPFLNWDFELKDEQNNFLASINKDWRGLGMEVKINLIFLRK